MKEKQKKLSLRDLIHMLGSKHQTFLLGAGMIRENLRELIEGQTKTLECKKTIKNVISHLERITKISKEADTLLEEVKAVVYKRLDPDKIIVSVKPKR